MTTARWRTVVGSAVLAVASAVAVVWALFALGLVDVRRLEAAFRDKQDLLAADFLCIVVLAVIAVLRNAWALRALGVKLPLGRIAGANLLAQGFGQWMPGSVVVSEGLRIGALFGGQPAAPSRAATLGKIGLASLGDRLIGFGVLFLLGAAATLVLAVTQPVESLPLLSTLTAAYLAVGAALLSLPLVGDSWPVRWLADVFDKPGQPRLIARISGAVASALRLAGDSSADWRRGPRFSVSVLLSALAAALNLAQLILASAAIGGSIPWLVLLAAYPATYIGVILPLGFAGIGAPQLVSVAIFAAFGVPAETVIAMSLLQSALLLTTQTALALGWAALRSGEIVRVVRGVGA